MAINPVQLIGQTRQMPDFVGDFLRGRQFKQQSDMQNRVMDMREQAFSQEQQAAEAQRLAQLDQKVTNYFGRAADLLAQAPAEQRPALYQQIKAYAKANLRPSDIEDMPETFDPRLVPAMQRQARLKGYTPPERKTAELSEGEKVVDLTTGQEIAANPIDPATASAQELTSSQRDFREYQRLLETDPQAAEVFGRQAGFLSREGLKLSSYAEKRLGAANDEAIMSAASARKYAGLAEDFADIVKRGGIRAKWTESYKQFMGSEDAVSALRQQYRQIRNAEVVKMLPPGIASDRDIEIAMAGFPQDTSNPEYISTFMRGLSKLAKLRADYAEFRARYISKNGTERGLLDTWESHMAEQQTEDSTSQGGNEFTSQGGVTFTVK